MRKYIAILTFDQPNLKCTKIKSNDWLKMFPIPLF